MKYLEIGDLFVIIRKYHSYVREMEENKQDNVIILLDFVLQLNLAKLTKFIILVISLVFTIFVLNGKMDVL